MLEQLREFGNKRIVRFLFALFLIIPFGFFGIDFYFKSPVGGDTVASVGNARIGAQEFENGLRRQAEIYRQQFRGQFDASLMENPEIRRSVLDSLVNERLVGIGAERAGVRIGDKELARRIAEEPFFQIDGRFSKERYEQMAKGQGSPQWASMRGCARTTANRRSANRSWIPPSCRRPRSTASSSSRSRRAK
jgi:peptidyl-prolyl cis-trans isomerase D